MTPTVNGVARRLLLLTSLFALASLLVAGSAMAAPIWNLDLHHNPTHFIPGDMPGSVTVATKVNGSPSPPASEVQTLVPRATAGQFVLTLGADTTAPITLDATATTLQGALAALPSIGPGNVSVAREVSASEVFTYTVTFTGALANTDLPQLNAADGPIPLTISPQYWVELTNAGDSASSSPITVHVTLPKGITRRTKLEKNLTAFWSCPGSPGDHSFTCTRTDPIPRHSVDNTLILSVDVAADAKLGQRLATAEIEGGGALSAATTSEPTPIDPQPASFGLFAPSFTPDFLAADGLTPERQAGAHPDLLTVPFDFNTIPTTREGHPDRVTAADSVRDFRIETPPGFIGNPTSVAECSAADFTLSQCSPASQVGRVDVIGTPIGIEYYDHFSTGLFNLIHPRGSVVDLALAIAGNPVHVRVSLDPASRYAIVSDGLQINETVPVFNSRATVWGIPADHSHDSERCGSAGSLSLGSLPTDVECLAGLPPQPFLSLPSQCDTPNTFGFDHYDSWQHPGVFGPEITYTATDPLTAETEKMTGCEAPRFEPKAEIEPTGHQANTPTGLDLHIKLPQNQSPNSLATPPAKRFTFTLPAGMSFSPSFADGLESCAETQFGISDAGVPTDKPVACPDASRIGEVSLHTPLLPRALEGSMYLAAQGANPFGSTFALYLELHDTEERGVLIKVPSRIDVDEITGQITAVVNDSPQFPFDDLSLKFRSGPRAPLINPPTCGKHEIGVEVASYARPDEPLDLSNAYEVSEGPNGTPCPPAAPQRPFSPRFSGGTLNPLAGSYSTFFFRLSRQDQEQELSQVTTVLPPGLLAKIAGIPFCVDSALASISTDLGAGTGEQASPSCPAASQVGTVSAGLGAGLGPNYFPGRVYLAGPYKGAPLSLAIVVPDLAGPFDLGNTVIRVALRVDPDNTRVSAVSDPFPTILHGVILRVRDVILQVDRPETTLNPTNCSPTSLDAAITGVGGDLLSTADDSFFKASARFHVLGCASLPFKPRIAFKLSGGTHRGDHPAFSSRLVARRGDANFGRAVVALPHSEFLENAHIRTICTRVQFAAEQCPNASIYGFAKAVTPLLDNPVEGPVILRSSNHSLPDLVAKLRGQISSNLIGRIDSVNGGIRTTFDSIPDVPIKEFTLTMQGGKKGLFVNSRNLCLGPSRADVRFTAQNSRRARLRPLMGNSCKKVKQKRHRRRG